MKEKIDILKSYGLNYDDISKFNKSRLEILLSLIVSPEELESKLDYLRSNGIKINKVDEVRGLVLSFKEIADKVGMLKDLGEIELYLNNPKYLTYNAFDICRRIKYCKNNNIIYKNDGNYSDFLFDESKFEEKINNKKNEPFTITQPVVETPVEETPVVEPFAIPSTESEETFDNNILDLQAAINAINGDNYSNEDQIGRGRAA